MVFPDRRDRTACSRGGLKSTVATLTEIYHFLRLLYVRLGTQYCPDCDIAIAPQSAESILAQLQKDYRGKTIRLLAPLIAHRKGHYRELAKWRPRTAVRSCEWMANSFHRSVSKSQALCGTHHRDADRRSAVYAASRAGTARSR